MAYATVEDVQARMTREMTEAEKIACQTLLDDAAVMIDAVAKNASNEAKKTVSCRMVIRALGDGSVSGVPMGATQGSISGLGYAQSWTMGANASSGELYISKQDRSILGFGSGNSIGNYSPIEELVPKKAVLP